jgi:hypothetical protein
MRILKEPTQQEAFMSGYRSTTDAADEITFPLTSQDVVDANTGYYGTAAIGFYPIYFNTRLVEAFGHLFYQPRRTQLAFLCTVGAVPVWAIDGDPARSKTMELVFCKRPVPLTIVFDLYDHGQDVLAFSDPMWRALQHSGDQVLYVKLQITDPAFYRRHNRLPKQFHVLSVPMLTGGGRSPITSGGPYANLDLLESICAPRGNGPYRYDWCWFGHHGQDRSNAALEALCGNSTWSHYIREQIPGREDHEDPSTWYPDYLNMLRPSRVNLSLTGQGPWHFQDAELLATDNFVLRQAHPGLLLNPLSPKNGVHWALAPSGELSQMMEYYLENETERDRIRAEGHAFLKGVLKEGAWSRVYLARLEEFIRVSQKNVWGELVIA